MGQLGKTEADEEVVTRARQLLRDGKVPNTGAGLPHNWLSSRNTGESIRRFLNEYVQYGTSRAADIGAINHGHARQHMDRVSEADMDDCLQGIIQATDAGLWLHSREVAATHVPAIQAVLQKYGITTNHLFRLLQAHDSHLRVLVIAEPKPPFTDDAKKAHLQHVAHMRGLRKETLDRYVWIDQKKVRVVPEGSIKGWAVQGHVSKEAIITNPLLDQQHKGWSLYYYLAVNSIVGAVLIKPMTGCHGAGVEPTEYLVSYPSVQSTVLGLRPK